MPNQVPVFRLYPGEFGLLSLMIFASGYMLYGSYQYDGLAGSFPRFIAITVLVLSGVLFLRRVPFFPDRIRNLIEADADAFSDVEETFGDEETEAEDIEETEETEELKGSTRKSTVLGALTGVYMLAGYFIGLLWITPFYVAAYLRYTKQSWAVTLGVTVGVTVITYGMMDFFNLRLETGWLLDTYQIEVPLTVAAEGIASKLPVIKVS